MNIRIEDIETLRKKARISYSEAKQYLEDADGDIVEALIKLEKEGKTRKSQSINGEDLFNYRFEMGFKNKKWFNIPFIIAAIIFIISFPLSFPLLLIALFCEIYIAFGKKDDMHFIRFKYEHSNVNNSKNNTQSSDNYDIDEN